MSESDASTDHTPAAADEYRQVELERPIRRGKQSVALVALRRPRAGELRGVALTDVMQMDVAALARVIPRVSDPVLSAAEINALDPADLVQIANEVIGFLLPKQARLDSTG